MDMDGRCQAQGLARTCSRRATVFTAGTAVILLAACGPGAGPSSQQARPQPRRARGTANCIAGYSLDLASSTAAVAVAVREHRHGDAAVPCAAVGYSRHVTAVPPAPLGGRVLLDAATSTAVAVSTTATGR